MGVGHRFEINNKCQIAYISELTCFEDHRRQNVRKLLANLWKNKVVKITEIFRRVIHKYNPGVLRISEELGCQNKGKLVRAYWRA